VLRIQPHRQGAIRQPSRHSSACRPAASSVSWSSSGSASTDGPYGAGTAITIPTAMALAAAAFSHHPALYVSADFSSAPAS
jgi:hypothetical protein